VNWEKSSLIPAQQIRHLGFIISTAPSPPSFSIPPDKLVDIRNFCFTAGTKPRIRLKTAQKLLGKLISIQIAFSPARRYSWRLIDEISRFIAAQPLGPRKLSLSRASRADLLWIHANIGLYPSRPFRPPSPTHTLYTDASLTGWGAYCPQLDAHLSGRWSNQTLSSHRHIQELELQAVINALTQLSLPPSASIHLYTDNIACKAYITKWGGRRSPQMRALSFQLWELCLRRQVSLDAVSYIKSQDNHIADQLSRLPRQLSSPRPPSWHTTHWRKRPCPGTTKSGTSFGASSVTRDPWTPALLRKPSPKWLSACPPS
jgi:ribonuclease HI